MAAAELFGSPRAAACKTPIPIPVLVLGICLAEPLQLQLLEVQGSHTLDQLPKHLLLCRMERRCKSPWVWAGPRWKGTTQAGEEDLDLKGQLVVEMAQVVGSVLGC